ncbi:MAG: beta-propeller domain-containing protein [Methanoregula sp.]|nr:beta-propeller domain-containing protein [Methanoregula sp.]
MSHRKLTLVALTMLVLIVAAVIASGCMSATVPAPASAGDIKKFSSADEIREYIKNNTQLAGGSYYATDGMARSMTPAPIMAVQESSAKGVTQSAAAPSIGGILSPGYSETNVQVAGVDEPDFVKNDARYIYVISGSTLTIVDAYPPSSASILSKTELEDTPREIFINGDRLVLLKTGISELADSEQTQVTAAGAKMAMMPRYPYYRSALVTHAVFYDISDRAHPKVLKDYTIDGDYTDARMIGNTVYLLSRESVYPYNDRIIVPALRENAKVIISPDVYYFDNPEYQYDFTTVSSFDARTGATKDAKTYLVGSGNIVYVSPDAMYVSYQKYHNIYRPMRGMVEPAFGIAQDSGGSIGSAVPMSVSSVVDDFNTMNEDDKQAAIAAMKSGEQDAIRKKEIDQSTTVIHKIGINNGGITYIAKGEVPGYLKNQFAMDEYGGNLRVATTSDVWTNRGQYEYNNVFVLDSAMKTIGTLTHIAEQEKIYSTRFIGDRLYMVTFKRVDPFFVIDLATPTSPKILGKLKIPGYSDYLHPYDKNLIIGIGKETATNDWGGVSTKGIKLALFDVSDVGHPRQVGKVEIGDAGSDSAALSDHKAFLFDKAKNLLVIPARVVKQDAIQDKKLSRDQPQIWYGAYVFGINPETGFVLRGTVEHGTGGSGYYWYGSSAHEVKRSLYIGDTLYTLSSAKILANPLNQINTTVATIKLDGKDDVLYPDMRMME